MAKIIGESLTLIDAEENKEYAIIVSHEDAARARNGKYTVFVNNILILEIFHNRVNT